MIDAANITNYNQTKQELEHSLLFWILAAGKNGTRAAKITNKIIRDLPSPLFAHLKTFSLQETIRMCTYYRTGCQTIKGRAIYEVVNSNLNLKTCSAEELEKIYGIGPKTARCFIMHSRKNTQFAGLDTHILKFLEIMGVADVPKQTPSSKKEYQRLEKSFIKLATIYNKEPAILDLEIWNEFKKV